jgi:N-hydroxyarylamine O-acetyltransferase
MTHVPAPLSPVELHRYLERVHHFGPLAPTLDTLTSLHRAHLLAIPYENLDIHLGRPLTLDPESIFTKLVDNRRGGWCYEMNGLFGRVLDTLGFDVTRVSGAVGRATRGDAVEGNHLVLIVALDTPWIADVGFGDGFLEPLPLEPGRYRQGFLEYGVERTGERWTVRNHEFGGADSFDFTLEPRAMRWFDRQCQELQTSPESGFVQKTVCQRFVPDGIITLRGAVFRHVTEAGVADRLIEHAADYASVLADRFDLTIPGADELFRRVWARHLAWVSLP